MDGLEQNIGGQPPVKTEPKDNLLTLYNNVKKDGYDLPDYNTFYKDMSNPSNLKKLHDNLLKDGYDLPDYKTFSVDMSPSLKKKESTVSSSTSRGQNVASGATSGFLATQPTKLGSTVLPSQTANKLSQEAAKQQKQKAESQRISNLDSQFKSAVYKPEDDKEVEQRLQERLKMRGVSNIIETGLKNTYNSTLGQLAFMPTISLDPLHDEKKQAKAEAAKNGIKLTQAELDKKAQDIFKKNERDKLIEDRAASFLENLDDEDKDLLQQNRAAEVKHLSQENANSYKIAKALQSFATQRAKQYVDLKNTLENNKKNGIPVTQEDISRLRVLEGEVTNALTGMDKHEQKILKNTKDLGTAQQEYDLFKREYGKLYNFTSKAAISAGELGAGLFDWVNYLASNYGNPLDKLRAIQGLEASQKFKTYLAENQDKLRKPVKSLESWEGGVNYLSDLVATQIPILATVSTGTSGLAALGMSSVGQKFGEMNKEQKEGANYQPWQMMVSPILHGGAEVVSEIPTLSILNKGKRVVQAAAKSGRDIFEKSAKERAKEYIKDYGFDMLKEQGGEHFTNFIQNIDDKYLLGKKDVNIFDNTGQVFKDTFFLTSLMKTLPHLAGAAIKPFQSADELKQLDINSKKLRQFAEQLNNESLTANERQIIQNNIDNVSKESQAIVNKTIGNIGSMPKVVYDEALKINKRIGDIKFEAETIKNGSATNKQQLLDELQKEYSSLQAQRDKIIGGKTVPTDVLPEAEVTSLKKEALSSLQKENQVKGGKEKEFTEEEVLQRANENYLKSEAEQKVEPIKPSEVSEVRSKFDQANELFSEISKTDGVSKKRSLAEKRRQLIDENPSIKLVYDNISEIHKQLENATDENGEKIFEKTGDCP